MNPSKLNEHISQIHQRQMHRETTVPGADHSSPGSQALVVREVRAVGLAAYEPMQLEPASGVPSAGLIGSAMLGFQRVRDDMQRERAVRGAQLTVLGHQIAAVERESGAYWRAKSAELTEVMNTYLQEHLLALESNRLENRVKALELAAATITARLQSIDAADYPDAVKDDLLESAYRQYRRACDRIQEEVLVEKYAPSK